MEKGDKKHGAACLIAKGWVKSADVLETGATTFFNDIVPWLMGGGLLGVVGIALWSVITDPEARRAVAWILAGLTTLGIIGFIISKINGWAQNKARDC